MTCYQRTDANCGECYKLCPTQVIHEHPDRHMAFNRELCDGEPLGIASCQHLHVLAIDLKINKADKARKAIVPPRAALAGS